MVEIYYRPSDQGEGGRAVDQAFLPQLQKASCLQALIVMEDFNYPNICWEGNRVSCKQPSRL